MSDLSFYGPAGLLLLAFLCKVPGLIREPRELLQRSVAMLLAVSSAMAFFAAIPLAVITAIFGLFAAGDAPVERLHDFDTYYATTPYLRAMICLYVSAHTVAALLMTFLCWRWSRSVHGLLRAGLVLLVIACLLNLSYDVCKIIAVVARWSGHDLDHLSTWAAPPLTAMASLFQSMQREAEIHDGVLALDPYFEPALRLAVSTRARSTGHPLNRLRPSVQRQ